MKTFKLIIFFLGLGGLSQHVWCQNQTAQPIQAPLKSIAGTARMTAHARPAAPPTSPGTGILFRETFTFSIYTEGIPQYTSVSCSATISTSDAVADYEEGNTVSVTVNSTSTTCSVPILATWNLENPTTDVIATSFRVSAGGRYTVPPPITLQVPANGQTVTSNFSITLGQ